VVRCHLRQPVLVRRRGHQHLLSWAKGMLSAEAIDTIVKYDISCAEELIQLTDEEWVPIPWLLGTDEDRPPGGQEIYNLLNDLLVSLPSITIDEDVVPIQAESECFPQIGTSIPIVREQIYKISTNQYFRVAGILLDGRVSGRHYSRGKAKGPRPRTQLDAQRPSLRRGSGFDVSIYQDILWAESTRRVLVRMSAQKQYWDGPVPSVRVPGLHGPRSSTLLSPSPGGEASRTLD
jgi:hypothetical protein